MIFIGRRLVIATARHGKEHEEEEHERRQIDWVEQIGERGNRSPLLSLLIVLVSSAITLSPRDRKGYETEGEDHAGDPREPCRHVAAKRNRSNRLLPEREREK